MPATPAFSLKLDTSKRLKVFRTHRLKVVYYVERLSRLGKRCEKTGFVSGVLTRYADMFEEAAKVFVKPNVVSNEPYPTTTDPKCSIPSLRTCPAIVWW